MGRDMQMGMFLGGNSLGIKSVMSVSQSITGHAFALNCL